MRLPSRRQLYRLADIAIPWGVGGFLILVAIEEDATPKRWSLIALAVVQGAALRWRRRRPELVTAAVLVAALGFRISLPEIPRVGMLAVDIPAGRANADSYSPIGQGPGLAATAAHLRQEMVDRRLAARSWARANGDHDPDVRD